MHTEFLGLSPAGTDCHQQIAYGSCTRAEPAGPVAGHGSCGLFLLGWEQQAVRADVLTHWDSTFFPRSSRNPSC